MTECLQGPAGMAGDRLGSTAEVGGQGIPRMDFDRRVERHFARRRAEDAEPAASAVRHRERPAAGPAARRRPGSARSLIGQHDHAVDQLSVTSVLNPGQVREDTPCVGRIIRQRDPVDRPPIHQR